MKHAFSFWRQHAPEQTRKHDFDEQDNDEEASGHLLDQRLRKLAESRHHWRHLAPWLLFHGAIVATYILLIPYILPASYIQRRQSCVSKFNYYCNSSCHKSRNGHHPQLLTFHDIAPINEAIREEYLDVRFNGSLWYDSPYKGPPTAEVEQAWQDLMAYGTIRVTADDISRIGHNLTAVQFPSAAGGGYLAVAMGTHQIHCLHFIWQDHHAALFPTTQANKEGASEMYERHYEHCIDYIRQTLMCNFDPGIIPYYWVRQHNQPTPDGNTRHKCVDWDALQSWLKQRAVPIPDGFEWHQPPDAVPLPENP